MMEVHTLGFTRKKRWSMDNRPKIDSRRTLILVFGPSSLLDSDGPLDELLHDYPESVVIGCSTAGEILGTQIYDDSLSVAIMRFDHTELRMANATVGSAEEVTFVGRRSPPDRGSRNN